MVNEIRDFGDKKTIVLYTDESKVFQAVKGLRKVIKTVDYIQTQYGKKENKEVMVGIDLYFPKDMKKWLKKRVRELSATGKITRRKKAESQILTGKKHNV